MNGSEEGNIITINPSGEEGLPALPAVIPEVEVIEPAGKKKQRVEREIHRKAFITYWTLGDGRTLKRVAELLGYKEGTVLSWSSDFNWRERINELQNKSRESQFKDMALDLLVAALAGLVKQDEKTGKTILISTEKSVAERIKLLVDSFTKLKADSREDREASAEGAGDHFGKGRRPQGVVETDIVPGKYVHIKVYPPGQFPPGYKKWEPE